MLSIKTILHPTDFSECSGYAFQLACALARDHGARLLVLHVVTPPPAVFGEVVLPPEPTDYLDQLREQLQQLGRQEPKLQIEYRLVEGYPATEILRWAGETKCDLIVMGTHGRGALGHLLMGSVAEQVVRKASCPVLTLKTPIRDQLPRAEGISAAAPLALLHQPGVIAGALDVTGIAPESIRVDPNITEGHPGYEESGESGIIPPERLAGGGTGAPSRSS